MKKEFFIGIDFSKLTFDATVLEAGSLVGEGAHARFDNNRNGIAKFKKWARRQCGNNVKEESLVCGENTDIYSKLFGDTLSSEGYTVWIESARQVKRSLGIRRGKDDRKDSRDIAEYAARYADRCKPYSRPSDEIEALQVLFTKRKLLVSQKGALQRRGGEHKGKFKGNRWLKGNVLSDKAILGTINGQIETIGERMEAIINETPKLKRTYDILTSMKGVGLVNAVALIVHTDNFKRFDFDPRKICSYWGVAPFANQSGTSLNGKPQVSGYADRYLKALLSEAVLSAMRYCPAIRVFAGRASTPPSWRTTARTRCCTYSWRWSGTERCTASRKMMPPHDFFLILLACEHRMPRKCIAIPNQNPYICRCHIHLNQNLSVK